MARDIGLKSLVVDEERPVTEIDGPNDTRLQVVPVIAPIRPTVCPRCGNDQLHQHGVRVQRYHDIRHFEMPTVLEFNRRRWRCTQCKCLFPDPSPDLHETHRATNRLLSYIADQCTQHPFAVVARYVGLTDRTIANMFMEHVKRLERIYRFETPEWLGIDEICLVGKQYRCVLTNVQHLTMYDLLPSRKLADLAPYFQKFPDREKVRIVTADLWPPYAELARRFFPRAVLVADRFHVQRMGNNALEAVRKAYRKSLSRKDRLELKDDRKLLLLSGKNMTAEELMRVEEILNLHPTLRAAWECKEGFSQIYEASGRKAAAVLAANWLRTVPSELETFFREPISVLQTRLSDVLNYFDYPVTNGYTESLNRIMKGANSVGRGYSFEAIRAKMLYNRKALRKSAVRIDNGDRYDGSMGLLTTASLMPAQAPDGRLLYYGPHLPTLADMLEAGEFDNPKPLREMDDG